MIEAIRGSKEGKTVGVFSKDKFPGEYMKSWNDTITAEGLEKVRMEMETVVNVCVCVRKGGQVGTRNKW